MAETALLGPLSNLTPSSAWGQPQRVHRDATGSNAAFAVAAGKRTTWYNCFDSSQIPAGATIDGVEISFVTGYFGNAGSSGPSEESVFDIRVYNGTSYSSVIYTFTAVGANDYDYPLLGGATSLHGLSWNASDQASFGFDVSLTSVVATPVAVVVRGCGMKVYYTESGGGGSPLPGLRAIDRKSVSNIQSIHGVSIGSIESIHQRK